MATRVEGAVAAAGTPGDPVLIAGSSGAAVRTVLTDASGRQSALVEDGQDATQGAKADAAVTNPASSASVVALLKGLLTGEGAVADAAVTNPASSASIIAALKGVLTLLASTLSTKEVRAGTAAVTSVNDSNVVQTLLASNANRLGATIYNDSSQNLFVKFGTGATTSDFSVRLTSLAYYEVPFGYTGVITGIWAADSTGAARVTEFTA